MSVFIKKIILFVLLLLPHLVFGADRPIPGGFGLKLYETQRDVEPSKEFEIYGQIVSRLGVPTLRHEYYDTNGIFEEFNYSVTTKTNELYWIEGISRPMWREECSELQEEIAFALAQKYGKPHKEYMLQSRYPTILNFSKSQNLREWGKYVWISATAPIGLESMMTLSCKLMFNWINHYALTGEGDLNNYRLSLQYIGPQLIDDAKKQYWQKNQSIQKKLQKSGISVEDY